jgi:hypothetical protein
MLRELPAFRFFGGCAVLDMAVRMSRWRTGLQLRSALSEVVEVFEAKTKKSFGGPLASICFDDICVGSGGSGLARHCCPPLTDFPASLLGALKP